MLLGQLALRTAVICGLFAGLGTLFCALRVWTRVVVIRAVGYEDFVLLCSWACALLTVIFTGRQIHYGLGEHAANLSGYQLEHLTFNVYLSITTYCASIGLTKIAILMQYQRVFPVRKFQIWCWSFLGIVVSFTIATVCTSIFACKPIETFWKMGPGAPECIDTTSSWFSNAAFNILLDLMVILLPMPVVRNLNLAKRQKWLLMGLFALGGVVCIMSIIRLHSLLIMATSTDPSWDNATAVTFSIVELNVALMSACLPTLKPLIAPWFNSLAGSRGTHGISGGTSTHTRKQWSDMPAIAGYNIGLSPMSTKCKGERPHGESSRVDDKIRVVTRVDIDVHEKQDVIRGGSTEGSTENTFRDAAYIV
ncbi:hypothetical protein K504DRAFT_449041 [Pleomassaria siparia CBS 279.74]|uniref:Rhodopsin domain-containing protein n=1 Tax=Pleomassaria siparia CBS 279.74 TaxID=1314801 RepID=A0A6G1JXS8_9PLEO|nr:hypothetical protein K504DRAFT_449041 [Pleomassaria siparia CBS 279.74]